MKITKDLATSQIGGKRKLTDEGFLIVPARIARTGIQEYRAIELGLDGDPMRIVRVYRSPDEVFNPDSMASFENKPMTDNHPDFGVDSASWKELAVGFARDIGRDGIFLTANLVVTDAEAIKKIEKDGKVELSNGYNAEYDWTPGVTPDGEYYDGQQRNIRGNHIALVDAARCGSACRVSDNQPTNQRSNTMANRKVTIDGIPFELDESTAAAVEKVIADNTAMKAKLDTPPKVKVGDKEMTGEEIEKELADKDKELADAKKDVITPDMRDALVADWAAMQIAGKRLAADVEIKGKTCDLYRRDVIAKVIGDAGRKAIVDAVLGGADVEKADSALIKTAFGVLAASAPAADASNSGQADPVADALKSAGTTDAQSEKLEGRDAFVASIQDAWRTK